MRKILALLIFGVSYSFAVYCPSPCIDTLTPNTSAFDAMVEQQIMQINNKILQAQNKLDRLNKLNEEKLKAYRATRALKQEELSTLEEINFTIKKLIKQENIRIETLKIRAKRGLND